MIVGNFLHTKGAETVLKVIDAARPDLFRFHILGMAEARYLPVLERLVTRNVTYSGRYAPGDLSLSGGQVALHLSIWPETWCISLSEVWQAGLIPIVSDIGALGERVTHGRNGFKVAVGDAAAVLDLLETLRGNAGLRDTLRANIGPHLWIDQAPYAAMLLAEYRALAPKVPLGREQPDRLLRLDVGQLHLLPQRSWKQLPAPRHILDALPVASFAIELPPSIREWSSIQRCRSYVDRVCDVETDPLHDFSSDIQVAGELNAIDGLQHRRLGVRARSQHGRPVVRCPDQQDGADRRVYRSRALGPRGRAGEASRRAAAFRLPCGREAARKMVRWHS